MDRNVRGKKWMLGVVYVQPDGKSARAQNEQLMKNITFEGHKWTEQGYGTVILGDFNGHITITNKNKVVGTNFNGKVFENLVEECNMEIMNLHAKCEGTWTWMRGESKSRIDYVLMNGKMAQKFVKMTIDEKGKQWEAGSDHSLIEVCMHEEKATTKKEREKEWSLTEGTNWPL